MPRSATVEAEEKQRLFDAGGSQVERYDQVVAAQQASVQNGVVELRNGSVSFVVELQVDPNTYPFRIVGGTIVSGICGAPWTVTGGYLGADLRLDAEREGPGGCANSLTVVGEQQFPSSWRGTYGFDGASSSFTHTSMFRGWTGP